MRLGKELIGKPVYSITDGRLLGQVKDLYLDRDLEQLNGLFMGQEGLFSRKTLLISRRNISVLGMDAVLVKGPDVMVDESEEEEAQFWLRRETLQGRDVDTPGGTKVATVGDVLLDEEANILGFSLAKVFVEGPVAKKKTVMREALVDTGRDDGVMTIDLAKAEQVSMQDDG